MRTTCICFITNADYLLPTLVAASGARRFASDRAHVLALLIDDDRARAALFRRAFAERRIELVELPTRVLDGRHIMHARLDLDRLLPDRYEDFLYIDSDAQVAASLDPLVDVELDDRMILAAPDPMSMIFDLANGRADDLRKYFASIGFAPEQLAGYFNSGVIRARQDAWKRIGAAALERAKSMRGLRFPDQDVLNLVAGTAHRPISLRWNFPAFFMHAGLQRTIAPSIVHFMSNPRPWHGPFLPWGRAGHRPYLDIVDEFPELRSQLPSLPAPKYARLVLQQVWKRLVETPTWRGRHVSDRLLAMESCAYV